LTKFKADQEQAKKAAKEKAEKEKKKEKEVKAAEKKAHDQFQKNIKKFENVVVELKGYLAAMNGDFKTAKEDSQRGLHSSPQFFDIWLTVITRRRLNFQKHRSKKRTSRPLF
jgi:regulator of protease activity HflC (stomatin/prohibitin superfamily)